MRRAASSRRASGLDRHPYDEVTFPDRAGGALPVSSMRAPGPSGGMADAADSKSAVRKDVWVRVPPRAPSHCGASSAPTRSARTMPPAVGPPPPCGGIDVLVRRLVGADSLTKGFGHAKAPRTAHSSAQNAFGRPIRAPSRTILRAPAPAGHHVGTPDLSVSTVCRHGGLVAADPTALGLISRASRRRRAAAARRGTGSSCAPSPPS
jgi:hypothetical protein